MWRSCTLKNTILQTFIPHPFDTHEKVIQLFVLSCPKVRKQKQTNKNLLDILCLQKTNQYEYYWYRVETTYKIVLLLVL